MAWPTPQDYNEAVQAPGLSFTDPDLRIGKPQLNQLGLPRPITGGFACVYKMQCGSKIWAVRCFLSDVPDLHDRYKAIHSHLDDVKFRHTVPFAYLPNGIRVNGKSFPVLKMEWVQGESLTTFVGKHLQQPNALLTLAKKWEQLMIDLRTSQIAHGDLQHGNVAVVGGELKLLDYDGMFVPKLRGKPSNEVGHRNYQLPTRTKWDFDTYLDNFSAWVIYVSLIALAVHPELWSRHSGGDECLIFRKEDFENPATSRVLRDLRLSSNKQVKSIVTLFESLFSFSVSDIPALDPNSGTSLSSPSPTSPTPDWWGDHSQVAAPTKQPSLGNSGSGNCAVSDPSWIIDGLFNNHGLPPVSFCGRKRGRAATVLSTVACITVGILFKSSLFGPLLAAVGLLITNFLYCYLNFKADPALRELRSSVAALNSHRQKAAAVEALIASIDLQKREIDRVEAEEKNKILSQKTALLKQCQFEVDQAKKEEDSQLDAINQRRAGINKLETKELDGVQSTLGKRIADLNRQISALGQSEIDERSRMTSTSREQHVHAYLQRHLIEKSHISGIGSAYKSRLARAGFRTAADINTSVSRIEGIGSARQAELLAWKTFLTNKAYASAPALSPSEVATIAAKYRQQRNSIESLKANLQTQFDKEVDAIKKNYLRLRLPLNTEQEQLRKRYVDWRAQLKKYEDVEVSKLNQTLAGISKQPEKDRESVSTKLRTAQKELFDSRWNTVKILHRFTGITFIRYAKYAYGK